MLATGQHCARQAPEITSVRRTPLPIPIGRQVAAPAATCRFVAGAAHDRNRMLHTASGLAGFKEGTQQSTVSRAAAGTLIRHHLDYSSKCDLRHPFSCNCNPILKVASLATTAGAECQQQPGAPIVSPRHLQMGRCSPPKTVKV